jgi:leader peptidase (prepilin peptidase)/N-methyltransferase
MSAILLTLLTLKVPLLYLPAFIFFFSALLISVRTDLETMLISRFVTLFIIPLGFIFSYLNLLPLTILDSVLGALFGYGILALIALIFRHLTSKEGLGQGDIELLAFIGSFTGIAGCWIALFLGSLTGSIAGSIHMTITKTKKIPFGPFLALGAIAYVLLKEHLLKIMFGYH